MKNAKEFKLIECSGAPYESPAEGAIYIAAGNPCEYEYVRYEF